MLGAAGLLVLVLRVFIESYAIDTTPWLSRDPTGIFFYGGAIVACIVGMLVARRLGIYRCGSKSDSLCCTG